jgi:uncharacterized protein
VPFFIDTKVFLRHLLGDDAIHSPRATATMQRIELGEISVRTSDIVVFEVAFTLQRSYRRTKTDIRAALLQLLDLPGIALPGKRRWREVFDLSVDLNLGLADAYHAVMMRDLKLDEIISFDQDFDRVPGVKRVAPW